MPANLDVVGEASATERAAKRFADLVGRIALVCGWVLMSLAHAGRFGFALT